MRIISGEFRGRKISPPASMPNTRPTTDIAKEGLFNILQHRINLEGIKTLDLFGGTGSISYEFASRGAGNLTIIEKDPLMSDFIKKNLDMLKVENYHVHRIDVFSYLSTVNTQFDIIFAGPPYALGAIDELPKIIVEKGLIAKGGYFILEHTPRNNYESFPGFDFQRNYGTTMFSFFTQLKTTAEN